MPNSPESSKSLIPVFPSLSSSIYTFMTQAYLSFVPLDAFKATEILFMGITVIVIILVTVMMERSFISKETKQIAILKAMGFRDNEVIKWQVMRFGVLAVIAVVLAMVISIPVTDTAGGAIFRMMGATRIPWVHNFRSLVRYPLIIVAVTVAISWITALYTGTVKARDTASIE